MKNKIKQKDCMNGAVFGLTGDYGWMNGSRQSAVGSLQSAVGSRSFKSIIHLCNLIGIGKRYN
jgi:hypothetical protein